MPLIRIDASNIKDWDSFHSVFAKEFGFPPFYGRNMNAWIDCMTDLDDPGTGMTKVNGSKEDVVVLQFANVARLPRDIYDAIIECSSFVNWRRIEVGEPAILVLSFHKGS